MEDIKDIQKTDQISRFLDTQTVRTNPFGENRAAERAYRRAERLVAAVYLLTNHVPQSEPVKTRLRDHANQLLSDVLTLRDDMRSPHSGGVQLALSRVRHLISMVRILTIAGYLSMQNSETAIEALDELGNFLTASQRSILSESITLTREELMDVRPGTHAHRPSVTHSTKDTRHAIVKKDTESITDSPEVSVRAGGGDMSTRSQNILEVLRTGGSLGIRDIAANLPEYSEKMIQRELLELVAKGTVRKIGLKRWSKYALAS